MVNIRRKREETAEEKEARLQTEKEIKLGVQDQYQVRGFELVSWVQHNKALVSTILVLIVLAGILFGGYVYYNHRRAEMASTAFLEALREQDEALEGSEKGAKEIVKSTARFKDIAEKYKSSKVAILANLYSGHMALNDGDNEAAIEFYQSAQNKIGANDPLFPVVMIGLGYAKEQSGDIDGAIKSFESVVKADFNVGKDLALWEVSRLFNVKGDGEKSQDFAKRLIDEYPSSVYQKNAQEIIDSSNKSQVQGK